MEDSNISAALAEVHRLRRREEGLWRLDSPTEAALVALLLNRQREEVVVESRSSGGWQAEPDYCFAHLAPPHVKGSAKFRHYYMLGQHHHKCALDLADQRGLLAKPQHKPCQEASPCSPSSPAAPQQEHDSAADLTAEDGIESRTPVGKLRAEQQHVEDSSPCNNILRRLAADIQAGSASTIQVTLTNYSSFAHRSTSSMRSRVGSHSDCGSSDAQFTPAASPGRSWLHNPIHPETDLDLDSCCADMQGAGPSPAHAAGDTADAAVQESSHELQHDDLYCSSPHSSGSRESSAVAAAQVLHDILAPTAVPCLPFKGFAPTSTSQEPLAAADSMQLETPRLELHWAPPTSTNSSSNGTTLSGDITHDTVPLAGLCNSRENCSSEDTQSNKPQNESQPANVLTATGSGVCTAGQETPDQTAAITEPSGSMLLPGQSAPVSHQEHPQSAVNRFRSSSSSSGGGSKGNAEADAMHAIQLDDSLRSSAAEDPSGFWSCDEEDNTASSEETAEDMMPTSVPCQLPLSPMLLKQLSQQLSFHAAEQEADLSYHTRDDDATTCCDWATVCSHEESDS